MKVLSLFDGISCLRVAFERAGIKVNNYYSSEIKPIAIKCSKENYPDIIQLGNIRKISYNDGFIYSENGTYYAGSIDFLGGVARVKTFHRLRNIALEMA